MKIALRTISAALVLAAASAAPSQAIPPTTAPAPLTFDDKGAKVGEQLPDLHLLSLDNEPLNLKSQLEDTTLLVTSSFTCPKSRQNYPGLAELAAKYPKQLHIIILYVIEAHPAGDPSPYRNGKEDITPQNQQEGILRRQPTKIEKRLALANEFSAHFAAKIPIVVDPMDNFGWKSVGAGPNMAILLSRDGKVLARQSWFDPKTLTAEIDKALARERLYSDGFLNPADKAIAEDLSKRNLKWWEFLADEKVDALRKLLKEYPTLNHFVDEYTPRGNSGGDTLLQMAAKNNHLAAARILLENGADAEQPTPRKPSALFMAASAGHDEMVALLIPHVKHIDARYEDGPTAMQEALYQEHGKSAEMLAKAGARENFFTHVARGDVAEVTAALAQDSSIAGRPDGTDQTPLMYAAATGKIDIAKLLANAGPPINPPAGSHDGLAVPVAVEHHHEDMLAWLLTAGADPNRGDYWTGTPAHLAVWRLNVPALRLLLKAGAKPAEVDMRGYTPLHIAAEIGFDEAISVLLDAGADVNVPTGGDNSPCGPVGAPNMKTPLMLAAARGNLDTIKLLLAKKADPAATDSEFRTALHMAMQQDEPKPGQIEATVQLLLDAKVPVNAEDFSGHTALDDARKNNLKDVVKFLEDHGGKTGSGKYKKSKPDKDGGSLFRG